MFIAVTKKNENLENLMEVYRTDKTKETKTAIAKEGKNILVSFKEFMSPDIIKEHGEDLENMSAVATVKAIPEFYSQKEDATTFFARKIVDELNSFAKVIKAEHAA